MKYILFIFSCLLTFSAIAQNTTQTVRGTVLDADSRTPLIGAIVSIKGSQPVKGASTDAAGTFNIQKVPLGRITLTITYIGYKEAVIPNIVVDAGKETILDLLLQESTSELKEIVITATQHAGETRNDMVLVSGRSISIEETKRYAGGYNDPARILSNFAGVTNSGAGNNEVIVRGNSPKYVQWRLEGVEITNPNHFADQNAVAGGISGLNNNLLATSDFYTGAFAPEYGDALSGVYDLKLRNGNNKKVESIFGLGILGTELTVEGPFSKKYNGSYLANYRYSSLGLISDIGLVNLEVGIPRFQDGAFKLLLPTKHFGNFSLFGLGGSSSLTSDSISPSLFEVPSNDFASPDIQRSYAKTSYFLNMGINHHIQLNKNSYVNSVLAYSGNGLDEKVFQSDVTKRRDANGNPLEDSLSNRKETYGSKLDNKAYRLAITYNNKLDARNRIQFGTRYTHLVFAYHQDILQDSLGHKLLLAHFNEQMATVRNFMSWKHRFTDDVTMVVGLHNMNVLYNNKSTLEPRFAINWNASDKSSLNIGYGKHSTMESAHNYFAETKQPDGTYRQPNNNLGLLKAHHVVLGYEYRFTKNLRVKTEAYYQYLYDLPVENNSNYYATLNEGLNFSYVELVNKGTGENYGLEITIEKSFSHNYYFLINGSIYQSTYKALDKVERHTAYADNYLVNILGGKEFDKLGKNKNQTLALNTTLFLGGAKRFIPLLRDGNGAVAVNPQAGIFRDFDKAYEPQLDDILRLTVAVSYKWNKPKTTHELFLNIDNITNNMSRISEFYDAGKPTKTDYMKQIGVFPNLMYRIYL